MFSTVRHSLPTFTLKYSDIFPKKSGQDLCIAFHDMLVFDTEEHLGPGPTP